MSKQLDLTKVKQALARDHQEFVEVVYRAGVLYLGYNCPIPCFGRLTSVGPAIPGVWIEVSCQESEGLSCRTFVQHNRTLTVYSHSNGNSYFTDRI